MTRKALNERIKSLESQVNKNSDNSSKPTSSDGFKNKTKSLRIKSGKKPGGQKGHEGTTLCLSNSPDKIEIHSVEQCTECGAFLKDVSPQRYIVRQIIDIPDIKVKEDLFNIYLSQGSMVTFNQRCHENLEAITNKIRNSITSSTGAVHFDETGIYVDKKCQWL